MVMDNILKETKPNYDVNEYAMYNSTKIRLNELGNRNRLYDGTLKILELQRRALVNSNEYNLKQNFLINYNAYSKEQNQLNLAVVKNTKAIEEAIDEYLTSKYLLVKTNQYKDYVVEAIEERYKVKIIPLLIERLELEKIQKVDIIRHKIIPYQCIFGGQAKLEKIPNLQILKPKIELDDQEIGENSNLANWSIKNKKEYNEFCEIFNKINGSFNEKERKEAIELLKQAPFDAIKPTKVLAQTPREIADKIELYITPELDEKSR